MLTDHHAAEREYVLRSARDFDVKFIRLWFTDILGNLKGFAITVDDLEDALELGVGFDGAAIEGYSTDTESDMRAFPDPTTFTLLPWRPRRNAVARIFCDVRTPRGEPFIGDPRHVLKRNLERLASLGYIYYVGPELEYFYLRDAEKPGTAGHLRVLRPALQPPGFRPATRHRAQPRRNGHPRQVFPPRGRAQPA